MLVFITATITFCFLKLILPFLKKNFVYKPNFRSSHELNIPTAGGLGFVIIGSVGMIFFKNFSILFCLPLAIVGLWDDKVSLNPTFRYFIQLITCTALFFSSPIGNILFKNINLIFFIPLFIFYLILSTGVINFINFMDGLDGLVGSCILVFLLVFSVLVDPTYFVLLGPLLGFLILNWHPAKLFMGDTGSTFLGSVLVLCLLNSSNLNICIALFLIVMPLFLDASISVIRRFFDGQNIFQPHSLHLFQRLHKSGWSHSKVSMLYFISTVVIAGAYFLSGIFLSGLTTIFIFIMGIWLEKKFAFPFKE